MARHVRKGDMVIVNSGDAGKTHGPDGRKTADLTPRRVLRVMPRTGQVLVEGVNVHVKHVRPTEAQSRGGRVEREMPIHMSNVQPIAEGKPTRVRFHLREDGSKVRVAARNGEQLGPETKQAK